MKSRRDFTLFKFNCSRRVICIAFVGVLFSSLTASAAADSSSSSWDDVSSAIRSPLMSTVDKSRFRYSGEVLVDTSRALNDEDHVAWSGFYKTSFAVTDNVTQWSLAAAAGFQQQYSYQPDVGPEGDFVYGVVVLSKYWENGRNFDSDLIDKISVALVGGLPIGTTVGQTYFEGSVGPSVAVSKKFWRIGLSEGLSYARGFYQYDLRNDGTINNPDVYKSKSSISFDITDSFQAAALYIYTEAVDFNGVATGADTTYLELSYQVTKMFSVAAGLATDRATTLDPNGQIEQVKFYDQENAAAFFDVTMDF